MEHYICIPTIVLVVVGFRQFAVTAVQAASVSSKLRVF